MIDQPDLYEGCVWDGTSWREADECAVGGYRYSLTRRWADGPLLLWVMLNPSTADAQTDDPTIRRVISFSKRERAAGCSVVNLFALRATSPTALSNDGSSIGPDNDRTLEAAFARCDRAVAAWGAHRLGRVRGDAIREKAAALGCELYALEFTSAGAPWHPLYVRGDAELQPWPAPQSHGARDDR